MINYAYGTSQAKAELWLAGDKVEKAFQYTKIGLMLGDEVLSRWTKFQLSEDDRKDPDNVFKVSRVLERMCPPGQHRQLCTTALVSRKEKQQQSWTSDYPKS